MYFQVCYYVYSVSSMHTSPGVVLLLLSVGCALLVPCLAQEANVSSSRVDCAFYTPECSDLCPEVCPSKTETLYIQVRPFLYQNKIVSCKLCVCVCVCVCRVKQVTKSFACIYLQDFISQRGEKPECIAHPNYLCTTYSL